MGVDQYVWPNSSHLVMKVIFFAPQGSCHVKDLVISTQIKHEVLFHFAMANTMHPMPHLLQHYQGLAAGFPHAFPASGVSRASWFLRQFQKGPRFCRWSVSSHVFFCWSSRFLRPFKTGPPFLLSEHGPTVGLLNPEEFNTKRTPETVETHLQRPVFPATASNAERCLTAATSKPSAHETLVYERKNWNQAEEEANSPNVSGASRAFL